MSLIGAETACFCDHPGDRMHAVIHPLMAVVTLALVERSGVSEISHPMLHICSSKRDVRSSSAQFFSKNAAPFPGPQHCLSNAVSDQNFTLTRP